MGSPGRIRLQAGKQREDSCMFPVASQTVRLRSHNGKEISESRSLHMQMEDHVRLDQDPQVLLGRTHGVQPSF